MSSGVWVFQNGVVRLGDRPAGSNIVKKVLVDKESGEGITSYASLEEKLVSLGWERYNGGDPDLYQFSKCNSIDLISLPRDFSHFNAVYMYNIVVMTRTHFEVRDNEEPAKAENQ